MLGNQSENSSEVELGSQFRSAKGLIESPVATSLESFDATDVSLNSASVIIIEKRRLIRSCLERGISELSGFPVASFASLEAWRKAPPIRALVIFVGCEESSCGLVDELIEFASGAPVIVMSDALTVVDIERNLKGGARGCVSFNVALDVVIEAIRLVLAGGIFVPAEILFEICRDDAAGATQRPQFTTREQGVVAALRKGKSNKVIAHELSLSESTVKLHVRNIMKKLQARNRTEVAIRLT